MCVYIYTIQFIFEALIKNPESLIIGTPLKKPVSLFIGTPLKKGEDDKEDFGILGYTY